MRPACLALVLTLTACGSEPASEVPPPAPDAAVTAPAPIVTPAATPSPSPAVAGGEIPARFRGVWDAVAGTCDPASDRRLEIAAKSLEFYESVGAVFGVNDAVDGSTVIDLAMEGEGEQWNRAMVLKVTGEGDGQRLNLREKGYADYESLTLKRCPT